MQFLLSWLADYVDLASTVGLPLEADESGRHRLVRLTDDEKQKAFHIGEKLTAVGLAVEGIAEQRGEPGTGGESGDDGDTVDIVFDVDVTSNRPDCMNHYGLARELALALATPLRPPPSPFHGSFSSLSSSLNKASLSSTSSPAPSARVEIEDPAACPRFVARTIRGVSLGPSPRWLRRRLEAIGLRPINNVVDATNYVLWETGQPLHAYDLATVPGGELRVRRARAGESLVTLDRVRRALDPEILVIADRERAIGLAGVMGGLDTEVTDRTVDVLLESAHFDRRRTRIGARRLGLHTDASHRFERGADFGACDAASRRCAALIVELAGGTVDEPAIDVVATRPATVGWRFDGAQLARFAGVTVEGGQIVRILTALGFAPEAAGEGWQGSVPTWRAVDFEPRRDGPPGEPLAWRQDLFEEVLRHVGLDAIPATLPALGGVDAGGTPMHELRRRATDLVAALGFAEAIHFAFQDRAADEAWPRLAGAGEPLELANPLSERHAVLRRTLVANLVASAAFNAHRGADGVRLFECGRLFPGGEAAEVEAIALAAGGRLGSAWDRPAAVDLPAFKGFFEALFEELGVVAVARPADLAGILPGTGGEWTLAGERIGWFGRAAATGLPFELFVGELRLDRFDPAAGPRRITAPPRVPGVAADLTLTHRLELSWAELAAAIDELAAPPLVGYRLEERYRGTGVPDGAVATTIRFDYNAGERSLTQEEVNERHAALAAELERRFGTGREAES
jgi:phenylalanyl-tRNA synthetase beta chain